MSKSKHQHKSCCEKKPWYQQRAVQAIAVTAILVGIAYTTPFLRPFYQAFEDYFLLIWWAILLGFLLGGIIDYFIPQQYVSKTLGQKKKSTIFYAVGLGFIMSACSHGILAIAIELYKKGASIAAVIAFLLAAPWANLPVTLMLFAFFGIKSLWFIGAAIVVALITGFIFQFLEHNNYIEKSRTLKIKKGFSIRKDVRKRIKKAKFNAVSIVHACKGIINGGWNLAQMVLWWILIGMMLASAARAFIPMNVFDQYFGPTILGLMVTLIAATIIEVCSEGTSPIAFEIYEQTSAFGNSFTFLMAGVITDYTEIGLIWTNIGRKTALWLMGVTIPQVLVIAYLFNVLL